MGSIITSIIKYSFYKNTFHEVFKESARLIYTVVGTVMTTGLITFFNKPNQEMLRKQICKKLSEPDGNLGFLGNVARSVAGKIVINSLSIEVSDYIFFRIGKFIIPNGDKLIFLGIINNWFEMR